MPERDRVHGVCFRAPWFITTISRENICRKRLFEGDSSHITTLANMTFKQIFMCKLLINYVFFLLTKQEK